MLALRVIPCLDVKDGRVVKGVNFVSLRDAGDPVEQARAYDREGADEVTFLDIGATHENRGTMLDVVSRTAAEVFIPLTVGGGVRSVEDMRALLLAGADKVSVNSAALADPDLVRRGAEAFGSQAIVVAVDARRVAPGQWEIFTHGGRRETGVDAVDWARRVESLGAGEILLTSMDRDGTGEGFDLELLRAVRAHLGFAAGAPGSWLGRSRSRAAGRVADRPGQPRRLPPGPRAGRRPAPIGRRPGLQSPGTSPPRRPAGLAPPGGTRAPYANACPRPGTGVCVRGLFTVAGQEPGILVM